MAIAEKINYWYIDQTKQILHFYPDCKKIKDLSLLESTPSGDVMGKFSLDICNHCSDKSHNEFGKIITAMAIFFAFFQFGGSCHLKETAVLWIKPPSLGAKAFKMPYYQALRIIRKQGWMMADVKPTKTIKNRFKAFILKSILRESV